MGHLTRALIRVYSLRASTSAIIPHRTHFVSAVRNSQYDWSVYQEPILDRATLELSLEESDKRNFLPVRAMRNDENARVLPGPNPDIDCDPRSVFHKAIANMTPMLKTRPWVRGGVTYQVPSPVTPKIGQFMGMKMLREVCSTEKASTTRFYDALARELVDASNGEGKAILKKQELHRRCEANRAYAHFRWQ